MVTSSPKILLIDSYDSFTHNLAHLIRRNIPHSQIYLIRNDDLDFKFLLPLLSSFSAVVVGPGPGSPAIDSDVGIIKNLWFLPESHILPVFGVCLGFQSFVHAFGGSLRAMRVVKHGMISRIEHSGNDLFEGAEHVEATRYHSLCVGLEGGRSKEEIEPLAWADDGEENGRVLMAARHRTMPFWGVQYHPESVCTHGGGEEVIRNFWRMSLNWANSTGRKLYELPQSASQLIGDPWPHIPPTITSFPPPDGAKEMVSVSSISLKLPHLSATRICELLDVDSTDTNFVMLESAAKPGRFSIIGAPLPSTLSVQYTLPETYVTLQHGNSAPRREYLPKGGTIWDWLSAFMASHKVSSPGHEHLPFWGGFVGYLSYELGMAELGVSLKHRPPGENRNADVNLVFVERSIVIDRETGYVHIQSLKSDDQKWLQDIGRQLDNEDLGTPHSPAQTASILPSHLTSPPRDVYVPQVEQCKGHLAVGSSYELCLTSLSTLHIPTTKAQSSWDLYKTLRFSNPAPHAAFLRLGPTSLLCSSPERFLKWDRAGLCELRPIKGTLRKTVLDKDGRQQKMGREDADELLGRNIKERAENLMIVDLIRHDLGGVVESADGVKVNQLMGIEEYETVWQMVSAISGTVPATSGGWEVLRRSLPPGSMTGAPKKRSVELLQDIEGRERGVYSGVCGYWCVGGGGDWAVIIRSCFRHNGNKEVYSNGDADVHHNGSTRNGSPGINHNGDGGGHQNGNGHHHLNGTTRVQDWSIGAGGAITALSDPVAEWEEMRTKLGSVGRAFQVDEL